MKIDWAEIKNFRSIKNSGRIFFNPKITILAGKNESGKSNILKALHSFSINKFDKEYDYPIDVFDDSDTPEVTVCFTLENDELKDVFESITRKDISKQVTVIRSANSPELIHSDALTFINDEILKRINSIVKSIKKNIENIDELTNSGFSGGIVVEKPLDNIIVTFDEVDEFISENLNEYDESTSEDLNKLFEDLTNEVKAYKKEVSNLKVNNDLFKKLVPNFIYFNSFEDIIPNYIKNDDESISAPIIKRFFQVVDLDPTALFNEKSSQKRKLLTDRVSAQISGDFMGYYSQDKVSLKVNLDGDEVNFFVYGEDNEKPFQPKQRSQGLQWFLAFYLTLQAERKKGSILLIDEPGLYLHATAQEDLLKMLESISETSPIVFSTHSQWLIDPNRLERLRLVLKDKVTDQTSVENKIHKGADVDTMKPIISAIGLELAKDFRHFGNKSLLVEGYSDYYYLEAMRAYFKDKNQAFKDFQIYPCIGSSQIVNVLTLIVDSNSDFMILLDNDRAGKTTAKRLKEECGIDESNIIFAKVDNKDSSAIEDLFSEVDYKEIVIGDSAQSTKKADKVLVSKKFNEKIHGNKDIVLTDETINNFRVIFSRVGG